MSAATFDLIKDLIFLLFFIIGAAWMWGKIKFGPNTQKQLEKSFQRSRNRFKWLFLIGAVLLAGLYVYEYFIK